MNSFRNQEIEKNRAIEALQLKTDVIDEQSVLYKLLHRNGTLFYCKQPMAISAFPTSFNFHTVFMAYKYDGIPLVLAYEGGKLFFIFRDGSVYSVLIKFASSNFIASAEYCKKNRLVITDFYVKDSKCLGPFMGRMVYIRSLASKLYNYCGVTVTAQVFYSIAGFFKNYKEGELEEGAVIHLGTSSYSDSDPGIYKWKRVSKCTIDLRFSKGSAYTSDNKVFRTNHKDVPDGVYEFDIDGNIIGKCLKKEANHSNTVNGVLYNTFLSYAELEDMLLNNKRKTILPHLSILSQRFARKDVQLICNEQVEYDFGKGVEDEEEGEYEVIEERTLKKIKIPVTPTCNVPPVEIRTNTAEVNESVMIFSSTHVALPPIANQGLYTDPKYNVNVAAYERLLSVMENRATEAYEKRTEEQKFIEVSMWTSKRKRVRVGRGPDNRIVSRRITVDNNCVILPKKVVSIAHGNGGGVPNSHPPNNSTIDVTQQRYELDNAANKIGCGPTSSSAKTVFVTTDSNEIGAMAVDLRNTGMEVNQRPCAGIQVGKNCNNVCAIDIEQKQSNGIKQEPEDGSEFVNIVSEMQGNPKCSVTSNSEGIEIHVDLTKMRSNFLNTVVCDSRQCGNGDTSNNNNNVKI